MPSELFSLKMRASLGVRHISGAEKIIEADAIPAHLQSLLDRAMHHANGEPDFVNFKLERLPADSILHLDALPVRSLTAETPEGGLELMRGMLDELGIVHSAKIVELLRGTHGMRGAILLDVDTLEHLEPDSERGVRATMMDAARPGNEPPVSSVKNHYAEAMVLATKVANAPGIIAELCISDDPGYVTGYIASKSLGYVRITPLKTPGSPAGGRIFLYRGAHDDVPRTIEFLEKCPVLVHGIRSLSSVQVTLEKNDPHKRIRAALKSLRERDLYRTEESFGSAAGPHVTLHGRDMLMFASNNYLDLANDPRVKEAAIEAIRKYGAGTGGSRLTTGTQTIHKELERELAEFKGTEDALAFATGVAVNSSVIPALCSRSDVIFSDELNHASIIDGCRLSGARIVVYRHNDMRDLARQIAVHAPCSGLIVSDGVFSMDGDVVKLPELLEIARGNGLLSMIDEAHATGVVGPGGHGVMSLFPELESTPDILMGTLSKALGSEGGFVCASHEIIEYLRNRTRSYIFSTAPVPASVTAARASLRILKDEPERVERLQRNVAFFIRELDKCGISARTESAIVPIIIGDSARAISIAKTMRDDGFFVSAIRYPSVPEGSARLRLTVMASHAESELTRCAESLARAIKSN